MFKKNLFTIVMCFTISIIASSKNIIGNVKDHDSNIAIPFVNISIKGMSIGTASDVNGNYKLVVSSEDLNKTICFSCIGYHTKEILLSNLISHPEVRLKKYDVELSEVVVMPENNLRSFLRKAYLKIPINYPAVNTEYEGFLRESLQSEDSDYIRLVEAITKSQKTSYQNKQAGTVQIIKSRKYINSEKTNDFPVSFYGTPHLVHKFDVVKSRESFLKAGDNYQYSYEGLTTYEGEKVHKISFTPKKKSNSHYQGTLFIHEKSLSYLRIEMELTTDGLEKRFSKGLLTNPGLRSEKKTYVINYVLSDSICHIKSIYENEKIVDKDNRVFYSPSEYVVTAFNDNDISAIPYNNQISMSYVPSIEASNYMDVNWKDYNILAEVLNIDTLRTKETFQTNQPVLNNREKLFNLIRKVELSYKIAYHDYSLPVGLYQLNFNEGNYEKYLSGTTTFIAFQMDISYQLSKHISVGYSFGEGFSDNNIHSYHGPSLEYKLPIKKMGKHIFLCPHLKYVWNKYGRSIGVQWINSDFTFGGKKFKQDKIQALPGVKNEGFQLGVSALYQLSNFIYLDLQLSYYWSVSNDDVLYLREKSGFILTRKTAYESLSSANTQLFYNGQITDNSRIQNKNWFPSIGLKFIF